MKWHVVCRIGEADTFLPEVEESTDRCLVLHFCGGATNQRVRENVVATIEERYQATLSAQVHDFLHACMGAYLADLCIPRCTAGDRWSRDLTLHLPVFERSRWWNAGRSLRPVLEFLTGDHWAFSFRDRSPQAPDRACAEGTDLPARVCLLSGGLDSLVGAIDLLNDGGAVAFVSHHGGGMTPKFQNDVFQGLRTRYAGQSVENQFFVVGPQLGDGGEDTMRSRSILFLGLGIAVACALGDDVPLVVPENGLISLNVPLTGTRVGSSSTRTTHPHFITGVRRVLSQLAIPNEIRLPYRHVTKGEMLAQAADQGTLKSLLALTMSCSHPEVSRWQGATPGTHCGYCLPCLVRRAAVAAAGLEDADAEYTHSVREEALTGKRGSDLRAVKMALLRDKQSHTSNILRVLKAGPLPPEEVSAYADVYARGMAELDAFLHGGE